MTTLQAFSFPGSGLVEREEHAESPHARVANPGGTRRLCVLLCSTVPWRSTDAWVNTSYVLSYTVFAKMSDVLANTEPRQELRGNVDGLFAQAVFSLPSACETHDLVFLDMLLHGKEFCAWDLGGLFSGEGGGSSIRSITVFHCLQCSSVTDLTTFYLRNSFCRSFLRDTSNFFLKLHVLSGNKLIDTAFTILKLFSDGKHIILSYIRVQF